MTLHLVSGVLFPRFSLFVLVVWGECLSVNSTTKQSLVLPFGSSDESGNGRGKRPLVGRIRLRRREGEILK